MNNGILSRWLGPTLLGVAALCLGVPDGVAAATIEAAHGVQVRSTPPTLSVTGRGVSLLQVLQEIGTQVGFAVVDFGPARPVLDHFMLNDLPLRAVLQQLLRGENHVILSRGPAAGPGKPAGGIERIMLLGPKPAADTVARTAAPGSDRAAPAVDARQRPDPPPYAPDRRPADDPSGADWAVRPLDAERHQSQDQTAALVEDLLWTQALAGFQASGPGGVAGTPSVAALPARAPSAPPAAAPVPEDVAATLARTTQMAQHNLQALLAGLSTATDALLNGATAPEP